MKNKKIYIGTSISPHNIEKQLIAIQSWIEAGFGVISCNIKEEIIMLEKYFSKVEFVEINRSSGLIGKPDYLPYFSDILCALLKKGGDIVGISNSDIIIKNIDDDLIEYIKKEGKNSLITVHRCEINQYDDIELLNFRMNIQGIDTFFIDPDKSYIFDNTELFVQSCWDIFISNIAEYNNVKVKTLAIPIAFHILHESTWTAETMMNVCRFLCPTIIDENPMSTGILNRDIAYYEHVEYISPPCCIDDDQYKIKYHDNYMYGSAFENTVRWLINKFKLDTLFLLPVIVEKDSKVNKWRYSELNYEEKYINTRRNRYAIETLISKKTAMIQERKLVLNLPIVFKVINTYGEFLSKISFNTFYLCPSGKMSHSWYTREKNECLDGCFGGYLDNYQDGAIPMDSVKDISESLIIIVSRKYGEELYEQLSHIYPSDRLMFADNIFAIEGNSVIYI